MRQDGPDHATYGRDVDQDAKIERFLLAGLNHYFGARYEEAIHLWTRALFLDRGHARARAYIERARSALAERQRESEELAHTGVEAFQRGDVDAARDLLTSAVERGGSHDDVQALLERVSRLEVAAGRGQMPARAAQSQHPRRTRPARSERRMSSRLRGLLPLTLLVGGAAMALYAAASWDRLEPFLPLPRMAPTVPTSLVREQPLPRPPADAVALNRAQTLYEQGRFHESLDMLVRVRPGSPFRPEADALQAVIQRALLAGVRQFPPAANASEPR